MRDSSELARARLLERVRKLYRMSGQTEASEHEAAIALRRYNALRTEHGFSLGEIDPEHPDHASRFERRVVGGERASVPHWLGQLAMVVGQLHDCMAIKCQGVGMELRGYALDVELALLTYDYLHDAMERAREAARTDDDIGPGRRAADSFRAGFVRALRVQVDPIVDARRRTPAPDGHPPSLIARRRRAVWAACGSDVTPGKSRVKRVDGAGYQAGGAAGARVKVQDRAERATRALPAPGVTSR